MSRHRFSRIAIAGADRTGQVGAGGFERSGAMRRALSWRLVTLSHRQRGSARADNHDATRHQAAARPTQAVSPPGRMMVLDEHHEHIAAIVRRLEPAHRINAWGRDQTA